MQFGHEKQNQNQAEEHRMKHAPTVIRKSFKNNQKS